jgi:hypothetical protein
VAALEIGDGPAHGGDRVGHGAEAAEGRVAVAGDEEGRLRQRPLLERLQVFEIRYRLSGPKKPERWNSPT